MYDKHPDGKPCASGLNRLCYSRVGAGAPVSSQKLEYDTLGRAAVSTVVLDRAYRSETVFDDLGRTLAVKYPTGFAALYSYSVDGPDRIAGVLQKVMDNANTSRVFWRIDTLAPSQVFDVHGNIKAAALGNGVTVDNRYDPLSGKAFALKAGVGGSTSNIVSQTLIWDEAGNLSKRTDDLTAVTESFQYDNQDRLIANSLTSTTDLAASRTVRVGYNAIGNILVKSDVGGYTYDPSNKPHAVRSAGNTTYFYDANGNLQKTTGMQARNQTWTDFNQPSTLTYLGGRVDLIYDADYKRVKEIASSGSTTRTVYMVHPDNRGGLGFEREETRIRGVLTRDESRHYLSVGGNVIAVVKTLGYSGIVSADPSLTNYWHKDSLGSLTAVTTATGQVLERTAFDAWGRRLSSGGRVVWNANPINGHRGFTGHEHLDEVGLVHMNGRVYDPMLGRFLSADSIVEAPGLLQSHNRYSYVLNNPLRYTDPSGHCIWDACILEAAAVVAGYLLTEHGNSNWKMIGTVMMMAGGSHVLAGQGLGAAFAVGTVGNAATTAFAVTMVTSGGNFEQSLQSAAFAAAFSFAGAKTDMGKWGMGSWQKYASHGLIGCVQSASSGGKCGPGAASAMAGVAATGLSSGLPTGAAAIVVAIGGGTASVIGGGKFASGAFQAGFAYLYNCVAHNCQQDRRFYSAEDGTVEVVGWEIPQIINKAMGLE